MSQKGKTDGITKKGLRLEEKEFKADGIEGTKAAKAKPKEKSFITCDDVLKDLRAKGHKV